MSAPSPKNAHELILEKIGGRADSSPRHRHLSLVDCVGAASQINPEVGFSAQLSAYKRHRTEEGSTERKRTSERFYTTSIVTTRSFRMKGPEYPTCLRIGTMPTLPKVQNGRLCASRDQGYFISQTENTSVVQNSHTTALISRSRGQEFPTFARVENASIAQKASNQGGRPPAQHSRYPTEAESTQLAPAHQHGRISVLQQELEYMRREDQTEGPR